MGLQRLTNQRILILGRLAYYKCIYIQRTWHPLASV